MLWLIVSNAAERSNSVSATALPESIEAAISFWILRSVVSVEFNLLQADWLTEHIFTKFGMSNS